MPTLPAATAQAATVVVVTGDILVTVFPVPMITNVPMALTAATATPPVPTPRAATTVTVTPVTLAAATAARMLTSVL